MKDEQTEGTAHLVLACSIAQHYANKGLKLYVLTDTDEQAAAIDDLLFALPTEQFVAHAQVQFAPRYGAPVLIGSSTPQNFVPLLINLSAKGPMNAVKCRHIIDLVPSEPTLKQQARDRYRSYQGFGIAPTNGSEQDFPAFN
nr:DNA polymerase III subunit chi [Echinimonas agarilytica]